MNKIFAKSKERQMLDEEIEAVLEELNNMAVNDDEYEIYLNTYTRLVESREKQKRKLLSKENAPIIANLVGIAMILYHEKANVITSKALGFVTKGRV